MRPIPLYSRDPLAVVKGTPSKMGSPLATTQHAFMFLSCGVTVDNAQRREIEKFYQSNGKLHVKVLQNLTLHQG